MLSTFTSGSLRLVPLRLVPSTEYAWKWIGVEVFFLPLSSILDDVYTKDLCLSCEHIHLHFSAGHSKGDILSHRVHWAIRKTAWINKVIHLSWPKLLNVAKRLLIIYQAANISHVIHQDEKLNAWSFFRMEHYVGTSLLILPAEMTTCCCMPISMLGTLRCLN